MIRPLFVTALALLAGVSRAQCACDTVPIDMIGKYVKVDLRDVLVADGDWRWSDDPIEWAEFEPESLSFEFGELVAVGPYLVLVDDMFGTATRIPCEVVFGIRELTSTPR